MLRLSNDAFSGESELHSLATYCVTETIRGHIEPYFDKDYKDVNDETLHTKVKTEK